MQNNTTMTQAIAINPNHCDPNSKTPHTTRDFDKSSRLTWSLSSGFVVCPPLVPKEISESVHSMSVLPNEESLAFDVDTDLDPGPDEDEDEPLVLSSSWPLSEPALAEVSSLEQSSNDAGSFLMPSSRRSNVDCLRVVCSSPAVAFCSVSLVAMLYFTIFISLLIWAVLNGKMDDSRVVLSQDT